MSQSAGRGHESTPTTHIHTLMYPANSIHITHTTTQQKYTVIIANANTDKYTKP